MAKGDVYRVLTEKQIVRLGQMGLVVVEKREYDALKSGQSSAASKGPDDPGPTGATGDTGPIVTHRGLYADPTALDAAPGVTGATGPTDPAPAVGATGPATEKPPA